MEQCNYVISKTLMSAVLSLSYLGFVRSRGEIWRDFKAMFNVVWYKKVTKIKELAIKAVSRTIKSDNIYPLGN